MRIRATVAVVIATLAVTLAGCSSGDDDADGHTDTAKSSTPASTPAAGDTQGSGGEQPAGIPAEPTGAERSAVLAAIFDVNAELTADEDKAVDAARNQCAALDGGASNPDHTAAERFSYDGITLTDDDGAHLNIGLRKTLCPKT